MKVKLGKKIGFGSTCVVYEAIYAEDRFFQKELAVKIISLKNIAHAENVTEREITSLKAINNGHNNIVKCFKWEKLDATYYFYLERMQQTLHDRVRQSALSSHELISIIRDIAKALSFIHGLGLVHCDLKPANIFLTSNGIAKIGDFGLSTHTNVAREPCGTPAFLAPEVAYQNIKNNRDNMTFYPSIDIYSFGKVIYFMLTRKFVLSSFKNPVKIWICLARYYHGDLAASNIINSENSLPTYIDPELAAIVGFCLKKNPSERASINDILYLLKLLNARKRDNVFVPQTSAKLYSGSIRFWSHSDKLNMNINRLSDSAAESLKNRSGEVDCWSFGKISPKKVSDSRKRLRTLIEEIEPYTHTNKSITGGIIL